MLSFFKHWIDKQRVQREKQKAREEQVRAARLRDQELRLEEEYKIRELDVDEALRLFYQAVETGNIVLHYEQASNTEILDLLPKTTREFFIDVSEVIIDSVLWSINRNDFNIDYFPGYVYVGEPAETLALVIKYHEDAVYLEDVDVIPKQLEEQRPACPTIFHYFLLKVYWGRDQG